MMMISRISFPAFESVGKGLNVGTTATDLDDVVHDELVDADNPDLVEDRDRVRLPSHTWLRS